MRYHFDEELSDILILHKYKNINYLHDELAKFIDKKLKQENARLREALEIYATRTNWSYGESDDDYGDIVFKYNSNDGYYFAQKALEQSDAK